MSNRKEPGAYQNHTFMREEDVQLPVHLDDAAVKNHLKIVSRTAPHQLPGAVRAIREKWGYKMGGWVEQGRLEYLKTVLLQLGVSNEILAQCLQMDNMLTAHRRQKEQWALESREGLPTLEAQAKAEEIRARIENAKAQQAEARRKRENFEYPATPQRELTPEEKRRENLKRAEEKLARLRRCKDDRLAEVLRGRTFEQLPSDEQDEYRADENTYTDLIRQAKEERTRYE